MMDPSVSRCPDDETLAAWVDGRLSQEDAAAVIDHASTCEECISMIDAANETYHAEVAGAVVKTPAHWQRWLLAAAAVVVLALPLAFFLRARRHDPMQELVDVSPRSARTVEARLSGGFAYAPYRGSMRANGAEIDREQMKLIGAAAETLDRAERDSSGDVRYAAAVAMVLINRTDDAIRQLTAETKRAPSAARAWSDLGAAQYAAALAGRTSLYPEALASANRALQLDPHLREGLFNRALILERLGLRGEARAAWQRYLDEDPSSAWADEAREHLGRLAAVSDKPPFDSGRQRLEEAAAASDEAAVRTLIAHHAERARAYAEVEYLGRWADALQKENAADADRWLTISRNIGVAVARSSGESLLRDAVQTIDASDPRRRRQIAAAHVSYRRGRIAFSRRELSNGERDLRLAAARFAAAGDPMSLAARSYAAGARLAQNDAVTAQHELSALLAEVDGGAGYLSLGGQVRWELARAMNFSGDTSATARVLVEAQALFRRAGEPVNEAMIGTMLAGALNTLGQPDAAWREHIHAFEALVAAGRLDLLDIAIGGAADRALRSGKRETARALVGINESLERSTSNDLLLADTLVRKSLLDVPADPAAAIRSAREASSVAARIPDPALRGRHLADADLAMAAALVGSDPRQAHDLASGTLEVYGLSGLAAFVAEPYLVRARASMRLGDNAAAERDLRAGMLAVEQHPASVVGTIVGTRVLDAGSALFEEAIRLDLERGDPASAFVDAERMRGMAAEAVTIDELRRRLSGSGTAVLSLVVLPDEVVSFTITEHGLTAARSAIAREDVVALAAAEGEDSAAALYDRLIRPSAAALTDARQLIIIPGGSLESVAFAALRDRATGRALIERVPVAIARSASALQSPSGAGRPGTIAVVELPSGPAAGSALLPDVEVELADIGRLYGTVRRVSAVDQSAGRADVLHVAGHTGVDPAGDEALAATGGAVSWRAIAAMHEMPPVVVLSACNTLRGPRDHDRRALSLAGAFLAAGARDVIGTLAPIGDADARLLFLALHEQLARGMAAPSALRHVQLAQLHRPGGAWRRVAVLTSTIHRID